jgi:glycerol-3-phosphate dehydrogenase
MTESIIKERRKEMFLSVAFLRRQLFCMASICIHIIMNEGRPSNPPLNTIMYAFCIYDDIRLSLTNARKKKKKGAVRRRNEEVNAFLVILTVILNLNVS